MSKTIPEAQEDDNKRELYDPPPVPPKDAALNLSDASNLIRRRRPLPLSNFAKPLPPPPGTDRMHFVEFKSLSFKPLPELPHAKKGGLSLKNTFLWIAVFGTWFLLVVVLLPVVLERDAMPGLNRLLRRWLKALLGRIS